MISHMYVVSTEACANDAAASLANVVQSCHAEFHMNRLFGLATMLGSLSSTWFDVA